MASVYSSVKQAMQDLIAPQLESLKGDIGALRVEVDGLRKELHTEVGGLRNELRTEIGSVRSEMGGLHNEMDAFRNELRSEVGGLRNELHTEVGSLRSEMGGLKNELRAEIRALDEKTTAHFARLDERLTIALDLRERIVAIEARLPR